MTLREAAALRRRRSEGARGRRRGGAELRRRSRERGKTRTSRAHASWPRSTDLFLKHDLIASLAACHPILSAERFSMASPVPPLQATPTYPHKSLCLALPVRTISLSPATLSQ